LLLHPAHYSINKLFQQGAYKSIVFLTEGLCRRTRNTIPTRRKYIQYNELKISIGSLKKKMLFSKPLHLINMVVSENEMSITV
jgi:hypothetical protein